jgi:hypothetical protein
VSVEIVRYLEPLNEDERAFLKRKETRDRRQFYRSVQLLLLICFALPFAMAWGKAIAGVPNPFSYAHYFAGVGILGSITGIGAFIAYRSNLHRVHLDLRKGTKTIERAMITRKRFMPQTNTCFFFLDSPTKLSIEVSPQYFERLNVGDEVNIEYSTYGKAYFGYF